MKFVELEIWGHYEKVDSEDRQYKNVLEDLNINTIDETESSWITLFFNLKMIEEEVLNLTRRKDYEDTNTMLEFYDGRAFIINAPIEEVMFKLSDTE